MEQEWKIMVVGMLLCSPFSSALAEERMDSVNQVNVELEAVIVRSKTKLSKADRNVFLPSQAAREASVSARDLIGRLHIPRVVFNPLTGEISMVGNGVVCLVLNGVRCSSAELAAVRPEDVIRVEHIDNPGPRYPDAQVVLNVVTRKHAAGGSVSADFLNAFKRGGESDIDNLSLVYGRGNSQWSYSGQLMRLRRDNWTRDYSEYRRLSDKIIWVDEQGFPSRMELMEVFNTLAYSLADGDKYMFNVKLGLIYNKVPYSEEADRTTIRTASDENPRSYIYEHMGDRSLSPSLDLYARYCFGNGGTVQANVVGTYIRSSNEHFYTRTPMNAIVESKTIQSEIDGRKSSLIAELGYGQQWKEHRADWGVRYYEAYANNVYGGDVSADVSIRQTEYSVYGRYSVTFPCLSLMGSAGLTRYANRQNGLLQSKVVFTPSVAVAWNPRNDMSFRYKVQLLGKMPALADMNDVTQEIAPGYVRRGNAELHAYRVLDQEIGVSWVWKWLSLNVTVPISHEYNPVVESVSLYGQDLVRMASNHSRFTHVGGEATLSLRPWKDYINLSVTPTIDRYCSKGENLTFRRTLKNLRIDAELCCRRWTLGYSTLTGYANYLYGFRLMRERNMALVMVGYKTDRYTVKAGVIDPFVKRYWMETSDVDPLFRSVSRAYSRNPTYFSVQLSLSLDFGRHTETNRPELENADTENGLLRGVK